ncbi:MAG: DMT family transporter [Acidobacteria bacterium]|nr:DMT family transporter [Acidobacteriota bacterium]
MNDSTTNQIMNPKQTGQAGQAGWLSDGALIALALMWGTSHVITKEISETHSAAFFTAIRFGLASLCFGLAFAGHLRRSSWHEIKQGTKLGLLSFAGIAFYVIGISFTQASKAGFITGLYLVFTPLIGFVLFRTKPTRDHLTGFVVAICGFMLLSFPRSGEGVSWGDLLILLAAVFWAIHIAATGAFAAAGDVKSLAAFQVFTVAVLATAVFLVLKVAGLETMPNQIDGQFIRQVGYLAVVVTFIAALIQTWAQSRVNTTHAVILYTLEPVTAAVFAYYKFGEKLSSWRAVGAALIIVGVMVSRLRIASRLTGNGKVNSFPLEADC